MIMHAGLFSAARGNEILIGKPMPLKMDQGYPGHWTVRDAANVCHTEWSSGGAAEFYGWKYSTVVPASHSGFEFSAPYQDFPISGAYIILGTRNLDNYSPPLDGPFEEIWLERCRQASRISALVRDWERIDPLVPDSSRAIERWNALSSLRTPKSPF